jgi:hypothetical protein
MNKIKPPPEGIMPAVAMILLLAIHVPASFEADKPD